MRLWSLVGRKDRSNDQTESKTRTTPCTARHERALISWRAAIARQLIYPSRVVVVRDGDIQFITARATSGFDLGKILASQPRITQRSKSDAIAGAFPCTAGSPRAQLLITP